MTQRRLAGCPEPRRLFVLTGAAAMVFVASCRQQLESNSAASSADSRLACRDGGVYDVGDTHENLIEHTFEVVNASAEPIRISQIAKSCGCAEVEVADPDLAPGEATPVTMKLEINPRKPGSVTRFREELAIILADEKQPALRLWLQGRHIPVAYRLTNRVNINTSGEVGESFQGQFDVFVNHEQGVEVTTIETEGEFPFDAELVSSEPVPGTPFQRRIIKISGVIREGTKLPAYGRVTVRTNHEKLAELDAQVVLLRPVGDEIRVTPRVLAFGIVEPSAGPIVKPLLIRLADAEQQALESVETDVEWLDVVRRDGASEAGHILVDCTLKCDQATSGPIQGEVLVAVRSSAGRHEIRVPVSGLIRQMDSRTEK